MAIESINQSVGFDQSVYDDLKTRYTGEASRTQADLDATLLALINDKSNPLGFQDAVQKILESLPKPTVKPSLEAIGTCPSFCATYLAMITDMVSEERRRNAEARALKTEQIIAENKAIAEDIKTKAVIQLVTGITQGVLSIAQGMVSMGMTAGGLKSAQKAANDASRQSMDVSTQNGTIQLNEQQMNAALAKAENAAAIAQQNTVMLVNARVQGFNAAAGGVNSIVGAVGQSLATGKDAAIKIKESETERMRATQQMLESLDESLKALIQKTLSAQDSIQQNMNATRTKILS